MFTRTPPPPKTTARKIVDTTKDQKEDNGKEIERPKPDATKDEESIKAADDKFPMNFAELENPLDTLLDENEPGIEDNDHESNQGEAGARKLDLFKQAMEYKVKDELNDLGFGDFDKLSPAEQRRLVLNLAKENRESKNMAEHYENRYQTEHARMTKHYEFKYQALQADNEDELRRRKEEQLKEFEQEAQKLNQLRADLELQRMHARVNKLVDDQGKFYKPTPLFPTMPELRSPRAINDLKGQGRRFVPQGDAMGFKGSQKPEFGTPFNHPGPAPFPPPSEGGEKGNGTPSGPGLGKGRKSSGLNAGSGFPGNTSPVSSNLDPYHQDDALRNLAKAFANITQQMGEQGRAKLTILDSLDTEKYINFRTSAETQRAIFNWSDQQSKTQVLRAIAGPAAPLVKELAETARDEAVTWADFLQRMDRIFVPLENSTLAIQQQRNARQGEREQVSVWHARCKAIYLRAFPGAMDNDKNLIYSFTSGLNHRKLREGILQQNPLDYSRALVVANTIYAAIVQSHQATSEGGVHAVKPEETETSDEEEEEENKVAPMFNPGRRTVNAPRREWNSKGSNYNRDKGCFVCKRIDHAWRRCPYYEKILRLMKAQGKYRRTAGNYNSTNRGSTNSDRFRGTSGRTYVNRSNPKRTAAIGEECKEEDEAMPEEETEAQEIKEDLDQQGINGIMNPMDETEREAIEDMARFLDLGWQEPNPQ